MKLYSYLVKGVVAIALLAGLAACSGENDPIVKALNDELDVDIDYFRVSTNSVYDGETFDIRWESSGAIIFDAMVYLSHDRTISSDDVLIIDERCSFDNDRNCEANERVTFECLYDVEGYVECEEDGDLLGLTDILDFLVASPTSGYVILELCRDDECEARSAAIEFE